VKQSFFIRSKKAKETSMRYDFYSRVNQQTIDGAVIGVSFYLAFLIRYEGTIPAYHKYQFWALLLPVIAGRLLTNYLFGLHKIQWRYIGFSDVLYTSRAYLAFSFVLLAGRIALPAAAGVIRVPGSVIAIEFLLSLLGAMGIRFTRRYVYEHPLKKTGESQRAKPRRLLLIGAGMVGANAAKEMATDPSVEIVGFLDDDLRKLGCVIAGAKVMGPTSELLDIVQKERVDAVLVCIAPAARGAFNRLVALLDGLPVTSKFVPTITEILDSKDGLHLALAQSPGANGGQPAVSVIQPQVPPQRRAEIKNRCVLITGGGGFIGSTLAERLVKDNQIILLDRFFRDQPVAFTTLSKNPNVRMIEADILSGSSIDDLTKEADIVIHAAAIVGVGRVCSYPRETLETNFIGTSRILKALDKSPRLQRLVCFSTSEVFGVNSFRVHEDTPTAVGPAAEARWSYAIAKLASEHLAKAYHRQSGMPVVIVRPFNVFGPRRLGSHAILGFAVNALMGNPIEIHGDGSQIRSWCYIEDFCDGIIEMIARPQAIGEDFNIGNPANTLTVLQLAQEIVELTGGQSSIEFVESPFPDIEIRVPSLDKARRILAYQPEFDLRRGLELTIEWYRKHLSFFEGKMSRAAAATRSR
jgi:nucleoside-diphosphate-sugar epimerase